MLERFIPFWINEFFVDRKVIPRVNLEFQPYSWEIYFYHWRSHSSLWYKSWWCRHWFVISRIFDSVTKSLAVTSVLFPSESSGIITKSIRSNHLRNCPRDGIKFPYLSFQTNHQSSFSDIVGCCFTRWYVQVFRFRLIDIWVIFWPLLELDDLEPPEQVARYLLKGGNSRK